MEKVELLRVSVTLSKTGLSYSSNAWVGNKTPSGYMLKLRDEVDFPSNQSRRVKDSDILVPYNRTFDTHSYISYSLWCLPNQESDGVKILKDKIIKTATKIREEALQLFSALEKIEKQHLG